ncbi:FAD:protein FMN transferase [Pseudobythopirellula maris]|nr:FAD:protein FMN transferase [Pseudobythopirellula maris]
MSKSVHSRRDFLRGKAAAGAIADVVENTLDAVLPAESPRPLAAASPSDAPTGLVRIYHRRAMACDFELRVRDDRSRDLDRPAIAALDLVDQVEDRLTVYRDHGATVEMNRAAAAAPVVVDDDLFRLLELCDRLYQITGGAFDPTSGPLSRVWGFHRREGRLPDGGEIAQALATVGWDQVALDPKARTVHFGAEGVEINFNSIGKGWALDRVGEGLAERGVDDFLMHGGRSTLLAHNPSKDAPQAHGWWVALPNPLRPGERLAQVGLAGEAFSTSGSATQFFEHEGRRFGHLIDPRTGWPAEGLLSASALAPTAAEADALSTAFYVMGAEATASFCDANPQYGALLVEPSDTAGGAALSVFNLPEDRWRPEKPD